MSDFQVLNATPLQDAAHALLLQKPVHDSILLHEFSTKQGMVSSTCSPF